MKPNDEAQGHCRVCGDVLREPASAPSARTRTTLAQGRRLAELLGLPFAEFRI